MKLTRRAFLACSTALPVTALPDFSNHSTELDPRRWYAVKCNNRTMGRFKGIRRYDAPEGCEVHPL